VTHLFVEGEPLETWGAEVMPEGLIWKNAPHHILELANRWRVHTRWWEPRETIWREYLKVVTDMGLLCLIYRDMQDDGWFLSRLYD